MTLSANINDLEKGKFVEDGDGNVAVRMAATSLMPLTYDQIAITYPTSTSEVFTYKNNGSTQGVITIVYVDTSKTTISTITRTS